MYTYGRVLTIGMFYKVDRWFLYSPFYLRTTCPDRLIRQALSRSSHPGIFIVLVRPAMPFTSLMTQCSSRC
jgi:hypothetical protein